MSLRIAVIDRVHNRLSSLRLVANFTQYLHGRSVITLTLPFLTSQIGYFQTGYGGDGTISWNGYNHTLTIIKTSGWAAWQSINGSVVIAMSGSQVSSFFVNDWGIPERGYRYLTNLSSINANNANTNSNTYDIDQGQIMVGGVATSIHNYNSGVEATAMLSVTRLSPFPRPFLVVSPYVCMLPTNYYIFPYIIDHRIYSRYPLSNLSHYLLICLSIICPQFCTEQPRYQRLWRHQLNFTPRPDRRYQHSASGTRLIHSLQPSVVFRSYRGRE